MKDQELVEYVLAGNAGSITKDTLKVCLGGGIFGMKPSRGHLMKMLRQAVEECRDLHCGFVDNEGVYDTAPTTRSRVALYLGDPVKFPFIRHKETDNIFWVDGGNIGEHLFTFDKKRIFNLFRDYPHELNAQQKETFDKENPYWVDFFADRQPKS